MVEALCMLEQLCIASAPPPPPLKSTGHESIFCGCPIHRTAPCLLLRLPAGIQAAKLEDLERRLRSDILNEAAANDGRVLCHREQPPTTSHRSSSSQMSGSPTTPAGNPRSSRRPARSNGPGTPAQLGQQRTGNAPQISPLSRPQSTNETEPALVEPSGEASGSGANEGERPMHLGPVRQGSDLGEDITQKEDVQPDDRVTAFWETIGGSSPGHALHMQ